MEGKADTLGIRFNIWRVLLNIFEIETETEQKIQALKKDRDNYQQLVSKYLKADQISNRKDPLASQGLKNNYQNIFENNDLKQEIKKDVDRTYQDKEFFSNLKIKNLLSNILFVWSKQNSSISYRQGMNEIAATIIYLYFQECVGQEETNQLYQEFNGVKHAEADIYAVFEKVMNDGQHMENFRPNYPEKQKSVTKKASPILTKCAKIQDIELKIVDIELFKHLRLLQVEFQIFLLRWLRCLFTREFHLEDAFRLWDCIFLEFHENPDKSNGFFLTECIALAMITYVRIQILEKDDPSMCLQRFLKYPPIENVRTVIDTAFKYRELVLNPPEESESTQNLNSKETPVFHQSYMGDQKQTQQVQENLISQQPQNGGFNHIKEQNSYQGYQEKEKIVKEVSLDKQISFPVHRIEGIVLSLRNSLLNMEQSKLDDLSLTIIDIEKYLSEQLQAQRDHLI